MPTPGPWILFHLCWRGAFQGQVSPPPRRQLANLPAAGMQQTLRFIRSLRRVLPGSPANPAEADNRNPPLPLCLPASQPRLTPRWASSRRPLWTDTGWLIGGRGKEGSQFTARGAPLQSLPTAKPRRRRHTPTGPGAASTPAGRWLCPLVWRVQSQESRRPLARQLTHRLRALLSRCCLLRGPAFRKLGLKGGFIISTATQQCVPGIPALPGNAESVPALTAWGRTGGPSG